MNQKISILGCGWLGKALAIQLIQKGYAVNGSTTLADNLDRLKSIGITPFIIDISKRTADISIFLSSEILIITITSKSIVDYKNLICQIEKSAIKKVIFISSTSVYPFTNGIVTEETPIPKSPLSEIENLFRNNTRILSTILRFGGLFGYDRKPGNFIPIDKKIKNPEGYINFIHRDDCIRIIQKIISTNTWNKLFNACSDIHPKRREFYTKEAKKLSKSVPSFNEGALTHYKIVNSQKLKTELEFEFKYANMMDY